MNKTFHAGADALLLRTTDRFGGAPGVVAMATDQEGNFYEGSAGKRALGVEQPMTADTVFALFSATKAITGAAVMQLIEEGSIRLSEPARSYVPEIGDIRVLTGFDASGRAQTRPPKRDITIRDLMLHTAGFGYGFSSAEDLRYRTSNKIPIPSESEAGIKTVLLHDPGEAWTYGVSIDWLGKIVERRRGRQLGEVMRERIFTPLGMEDTGFTLTDGMKSRLATVHLRAADGKVAPKPGTMSPHPPAYHSGGGGLYGTVADFMKFIRMVLNDGSGPGGRVLRPETVAAMCVDGLQGLGLQCTGWNTAVPALSNSCEFLPGDEKGWGYTFLINRQPMPSGRPAGSLAWAGLPNLYYWIDRQNGIGGFWATQILPFLDIASYPAYQDFETIVYRSLPSVRPVRFPRS